MNLVARVKAAFTSERWIRSSVSLLSGGQDAKRQSFSQLHAINAYRSWIYAAANLNAVAVASTPLRLYVKNRSTGYKLWNTRKASRQTKAFLAGDSAQRPSVFTMRKVAEYADDYEVVTDSHPLLELLSKVNPYQNGYDATILRVLYTELTGNAYIHPVMDAKLNRPVQLWTMPSQYVEIVPSKEKFIEAYLYGASREQRKIFAPDEVIHFKRPNPADLYYGLGKVEAAWGVVQMNAAMHDMDLSFFENKARPDYLLTVKSDASPAELDRLEAQIDEKLRGSRRTGRFLTATAEVDLKPLSFPPKDLAGRENVVEEIAAIFGVPVSMLKANDPNLASASVGFASWKETTILPMLRMDEEILNQNLVPLFGIGEDAFLAYDNPVAEDKRLALEERRTAVVGGWRTANEARTEEGHERIDSDAADALLVNGQPLGGVPAPVAPSMIVPAQDAKPVAQAPQAVTAAPEIAAPAPVALETAQVAALVDMVEQVKAGALPLESAREIARVAFPIVAPASIDAIFAPLVGVAIAPAVKAFAPSLSLASIETKAVDTKPPQTVADNAQRALDVRAEKPESQRGMTAVGIARARDLINRENLSKDTIRRMVSFFERHEIDKSGETWDDQGKGWQAWNGWGGDEGFAWARAKVEEFDREREQKSLSGCGCVAGNKSFASELWTKASRKDAEREFDDITEDEGKFSDSVEKVFRRQINAVLNELNATTEPNAALTTKIEKLLRSVRWDRELLNALRPYLQASLAQGIKVGFDTVNKLAVGIPDFNPQRPEIQAYTETESVRLSRGVVKGVKQYLEVRVSKIIGEGVEQGFGVQEIAKQVQAWAGEAGDEVRSTRKRALMIARTESQRAARAGELEAWKSSGIIEGKTWLLAPDPCEFCEAVSDEFSKNAVGLEDSFFTKGTVLTGADGGEFVLDYEDIGAPPLHPHCRCSLQPQISSDYADITARLDAAGANDDAWTTPEGETL